MRKIGNFVCLCFWLYVIWEAPTKTRTLESQWHADTCNSPRKL